MSLTKSGFLDSELLAGRDGNMCEERTARDHFHTAAASHSEIQTPYGPIVQCMDLPLSTENFAWNFISPFAVLYHICRISPPFASLVQTHLQSQTNNLILYFDETRPGNVLRVDSGRLVMCVYWSLREFPEFLRCRSVGWIPFGFIRSSKLNELKGGLSNLGARILRIFFAKENFSFSMGCRLVVNDNNIFVKANFGGFLGDEKALKELFNVTGSAGTKPCLCCKNLGSKHNDFSGHEYFVGLDCSNFLQLDQHSDESIYEMVNMLRDQQPHTNKKQFRRLMQVLGLMFDDQSLLFQDDLKPIVKPYSHTIWDWMHCLVSNGVADVELGLFAQAMCGAGISMKQLEAFVLEFRGLHSVNAFGKDFLAKRLKGDGSAFKGFSEELLSLLPLVQVFCDMVLVPLGILGRHIACFNKLCVIIEVLKLGDEAVNHVTFLRDTIKEHHELYIELYGLDETKPKLHYVMHLPDLQRLGINLSCFVTERKHRLCKAVGARTFAHFESVLLQDVLLANLGSYFSGQGLELEELEKNTPLGDEDLFEAFRVNYPGTSSVFVSTSATLAFGTVKRRDLVLLTWKSSK